MLVASYITSKARKGAVSAIEGRGLVAVAPIAADEVVAIKGGHIITTEAMRSLPERLRNSEIQIADGFHLAALEEAEYEPVMLFINHSCGTIGGRDWRRPELQRKYGRYFSSYLIRRLEFTR